MKWLNIHEMHYPMQNDSFSMTAFETRANMALEANRTDSNRDGCLKP